MIIDALMTSVECRAPLLESVPSRMRQRRLDLGICLSVPSPRMQGQTAAQPRMLESGKSDGNLPM